MRLSGDETQHVKKLWETLDTAINDVEDFELGGSQKQACHPFLLTSSTNLLNLSLYTYFFASLYAPYNSEYLLLCLFLQQLTLIFTAPNFIRLRHALCPLYHYLVLLLDICPHCYVFSALLTGEQFGL